MATKIQIRRGLEQDLPILSIGELGLTLDTRKVFIGTSEGNIQVGGGDSTESNILFDIKENFPVEGVSNILYIATDENAGYLWEDGEYVPVQKEVDLSLFINNVTYNNDTGILTFTRGDGSNIEVDLPLEFLVEDGFYDPATKEIVLILANETEIRIPVGDLISGFATTEYVNEELDKKVDKQQDVADAGKVLGIDEAGLVVPVEQSGGGSSDTLKYGGAFYPDGTFREDSVTTYTQELANTNIKDIDKVKYNNYYFNSIGEGSIAMGTRQTYQRGPEVPIDLDTLGTPSEAYEYIFTEGAVLSNGFSINPDTGAMEYYEVIPTPEDITEVYFHVTTENMDPTLTTNLIVVYDTIDHVNRTINLAFCATIDISIEDEDDVLYLTKNCIYTIIDGHIKRVQKGYDTVKESNFVGIIDSSGNITEGINYSYTTEEMWGLYTNIDSIYMDRGLAGDVYVQAGESGSTTIDGYNLTYDLGDYIFIGSYIVHPSDIRIIKPVVVGGGGVDANKVAYNNTTSGLTAVNVQDALDELEAEVSTISGGGSSDTLKYGGAFYPDGAFREDSVTPYTHELAYTNIKDIDKVKYNNYYFNSIGEGSIAMGTRQTYRIAGEEPIDLGTLGTPSEAYEYIFTDDAILSSYNDVNEDTGAMIYDGVIPSPEDITVTYFYVTVENIDPTLTKNLFVSYNTVDHVNRTIDIGYCATRNVELQIEDDWLSFSRDNIYVIKDGRITSVLKGRGALRESNFVGIIDSSGVITESIAYPYGMPYGYIMNLYDIYNRREEAGNVYVQAGESGSITIDYSYILTYDLGDYIFIGSDIQSPSDIRVVKPVVGIDDTKQDKLVSGVNIKTINNTSLLGSGDITISGGGEDTELRNNSVKIANGSGGFAGGLNASSTDGGAVGSHAISTYGGAVGSNASSADGGAVGWNASSADGGAVGRNAKTSIGFAGGDNARAVNSNNEGIDAIQLGQGTNSNPNTLQVYDYQLMDADGKIPAERLPEISGGGSEISPNGIDYLKDPDKTYLVIKIPESNNTFELSTGTDGNPNYTIEWGDGESEDVTGTANPTHVYEEAGMYLITISDNFENGIVVGYDENINKDKIIEVYGGSNYPLSIGDEAFAGCTSLTTANFPNATGIGGYAFQGCTSLTTANIPSATEIGYEAFGNCTALTTANFPNVTSIGDYAFQFCSNLTTANFPNATSIGINSFFICSSLTTVNFPKATSIGGSAFTACSSLTTAYFPKVTSIESVAFNDCTSLKELTLGNVTTTSTYSTFENVKLVNLTIAQDVTETDIDRIKQFYADNDGTFTGAQINSIE